MGFLMYLTITLFISVAVILILLILIQKGRGGGLASAFGGAGGNTAFGSKTGDVLTWATSIIFGIFLLLSICLNLLAKNQSAIAAGPTGAAGTAGEGTAGQLDPQVPPITGTPPAVAGDRIPDAERPPSEPKGFSSPAPAPSAPPAVEAAPTTQPG